MREITYHKEGDYYIPNLYLAENEEGAKFDMITDKLQELLKDKDYSNPLFNYKL